MELLPSGATDQRIQLARRLAAEDSSTDLMNLDPVFVAEFANAEWLAEIPGDLASEITSSAKGDGDYLAGAAETVVWEDKAFAIPLWANTQVLWYRKSLAEAAGLDMTQPVTWEQVIQAAADNNGSVGVQANKYEAYVVLINALMQGAGGDIVSDTEEGRDTKVDVDSEAGEDAAAIIKMLADSKAAQSDLSVSNEGTSLGRMFPADARRPRAPESSCSIGRSSTSSTRDRSTPARSPRSSSTTWATRVTRRRSRASPPSRRSVASTSGSAPTRRTRTSRWRPHSASPRPRRRSTWP